MRLGEFLFTVLILLAMLALIGFVDWSTVGSWGLFMLILALAGPTLLITFYLVVKLKESTRIKELGKRLGRLFNWVIVISAVIFFALVLLSQRNIDPFNIQKGASNNITQKVEELPNNEPNQNNTQANSIESGYYIGVFSGWKQGGTKRHDWLVKKLRKKFYQYQLSISCIQGLDKGKYTSIEIKKYRDRNPRFLTTNNCKESREVFIGPFESESIAKNFYVKNQIESMDLHLYENFYECEYTCKESEDGKMN